MASTGQTIDVYRGERIAVDFTMTPVEDISGWTLLFTMARSESVVPKLIQVAGAVVSGPAGTYRVVLSSAETNIKPGNYQWDAWRTDVGSERLLASGPFRLRADVRFPEA